MYFSSSNPIWFCGFQTSPYDPWSDFKKFVFSGHHGISLSTFLSTFFLLWWSCFATCCLKSGPKVVVYIAFGMHSPRAGIVNKFAMHVYRRSIVGRPAAFLFPVQTNVTQSDPCRCKRAYRPGLQAGTHALRYLLPFFPPFTNSKWSH